MTTACWPVRAALSNGHDRVRGPGSAAYPAPAKSLRSRRLCKFIESTARYRRIRLSGRTSSLYPSRRTFIEAYLRQHERSGETHHAHRHPGVGRRTARLASSPRSLGGRLVNPRRSGTACSTVPPAAGIKPRSYSTTSPSRCDSAATDGPRAITDSAKKIKGLALNTEYRTQRRRDGIFRHQSDLTSTTNSGESSARRTAWYDALETFWWRPG